MKILVIGSINVDLVSITDKLPLKGETLTGKEFHIFPGGKGANQAVAASRLGGDVTFYGKIGNDDFANKALFNFKKSGIDTTYVQKTNKKTGIANIIISDSDNRIIVFPGANSEFNKDEFDNSILDRFDIVLVQYEIDVDFTHKVIEEAYLKNKIIILNPAPYSNKFNQEILEKVTYITPNEIEAKMMFGDNYPETMEKYPNKIIVTLGKEGVTYYDGESYSQVIAENVPVVDTTGAGDTFNGAFAAALAENKSLGKAIMYACVAATKSVQKIGAQNAMPWKGKI